MNPKLEGWSIVLAGSWNTRLFSPEWIATHVFQHDEIEIEVPSISGAPHRYTAKGVRVTPSANAVAFAPQSLDDACLQECENQAVRLLQTLLHTPIRGVGSNFAFSDESPESSALQLFNLADHSDLATAGYSVETTEIARRISYAEGDVNMKLALLNGAITATFNFHRTVETTAQAADALARTFLTNRNRVTSLLANAYSFSLSNGMAEA